MDLLILLYILNATLLILHEIESGYEKEWEILNLPGKITGFLILHIPILLLLFYGLLAVYNQTTGGLIISMITGLGGILPFLIHKVLVNRKNNFNLLISNIIIYLNLLTGILIFIYSTYFLFQTIY